MIGTQTDLVHRYASVLEEFLSGAGESALKRARQLGREAIERGLGVVQMASIHHEARSRLLAGTPTGERTLRIIHAGEALLVESLTEFEKSHQASREAGIALQRLNDRLEEEVRRIAHGVHDEAGQLLVSVHIALQDIAGDVPAGARQRLAEVRGLLDRIENQLRNLSLELRPTMLDDLGLVPALEFLTESVSVRSGITIPVRARLKQRLSPPLETALYRVVQEALNNMVKHSGASRGQVEIIAREGEVECRVSDNGPGFDITAKVSKGGHRGLGLVAMKERLSALGGTLRLTSAPGTGSELLVTIPTEV